MTDDDWAEDDDEFDHFVDAQDTVFDKVRAELAAGRKETHWMWFVFPVLTGIGESPMAMFYSLRDAEEAREYAAHPVLGPRLEDSTRLVMQHADRTPAEILGDVDAYKLRACATLFEAATVRHPVFAALLDQRFGGQRCSKTLRLLREGAHDVPIT